jgi:hypothetical protein
MDGEGDKDEKAEMGFQRASPILMGQLGCRTTDRWYSITRPVAAPEQRPKTVEFMEEVRA